MNYECGIIHYGYKHELADGLAECEPSGKDCRDHWLSNRVYQEIV